MELCHVLHTRLFFLSENENSELKLLVVNESGAGWSSVWIQARVGVAVVVYTRHLSSDPFLAFGGCLAAPSCPNVRSEIPVLVCIKKQ
jgi:hypothetical protein